MSKLPPLNNLPSWSRSSLERRKVQRTITKDPIVPFSRIDGNTPLPSRTASGMKFHCAKVNASDTRSVPSSPNVHDDKARSRRETHLEKSICFLQQQHEETLSHLHNEIEQLKSENKELNFKLIVTNGKSTPPSANETGQKESGSYYRSKIRRLESEIKHMKLNLMEAHKQNVDLSKRLRERELSGKRYRTLPPVSSRSSGKHSSSQSVNEMPESNSSCKGAENLSSRENSRDQSIDHLKLFSPGKTTVLQVTFGKKGEIYVKPSTGAGSRSPTISECKDIIHYLDDTNKKQFQELSRLKEEIGGNASAKFSPDSYVVTKTLNGRTHYDQNSIILPALRPAGSGNVAERRRGQQAVLRGQEKRDMNY